MYHVSYQNDLEAETCDYAVDIVRVLLLKSKWKNKDNKLTLKYYIDDTNDGKILVILTNPIKIYPLRIDARNNRLKYNIDYAIREVLVNLGINVKYNEEDDVNTLSVDVNRFDEAKNIYYGILQSVNHIQINNERLELLLGLMIDTFMDMSKWSNNRGSACLNYDIKYIDENMYIWVNNRIANRIPMSTEEYDNCMKSYEKELTKYNILKYGNGVGQKFLSCYDITSSFRLYCSNEMNLKVKNF